MGGRGRTLILIGVIVLLGGVLVVALMLRGGAGQPAATPTPAPKVTKIVVAVQTIPRGSEVLSGTVALRDWPAEHVPPGALLDINQALGQYARFEIPKGLPILASLLAETAKAALFEPSELPKQIPAGKVAVALPITRLSSVAYALKPGDHVDVLASFWVLELDEEFQTKLFNKYLVAQATGTEGAVTFVPLEWGGRDRPPVLGFPAIEQPREDQRPRLVVQLTVQNMEVLGVGDWLSQAEAAPAATPVPQQGQPTPAPSAPAAPDMITVIVDPQDALVLKFLREAGVIVDLALRSAEDAYQMFTTESVTLQYMFTRFDIAEPPKLKYGLEPKYQATPRP